MNQILTNEEFLKEYDVLKDRSIENMIVISIDIDNTKEIFSGKIAEKTKGEILNKIVEFFPDYFISSFGNDTFTLLNYDFEYDLFRIGQRKEQLQSSLSKCFNRNITFCWGVASFPFNVRNKRELLSISFESLYMAKAKGVDEVHIYQESSMKLKSVYFRTGQLKQLQNLSKEINKNESEILREALDEYLNKRLYLR